MDNHSTFRRRRPFMAVLLVCILPWSSSLGGDGLPLVEQTKDEPRLAWIRVSEDGTRFVESSSGRDFVIWGVNYDHDDAGRLIEDYWHDHWNTVVADFREIRQLGANVVRIHLQLAKFMDAADQPNAKNLNRLAELLRLAQRNGLRLDLTGLGCYHKQDVPAWYDALDESERWHVQARFWQAVARTCKDSPAVFCYDLMNEPILPGIKPESEWLTGELGGKHFVQRISLDLVGRTRIQVARDWVSKLTQAIRQFDDRHLITVGVIPWANVFPGAKPLFYSPEVGTPLDFVSVHFYPKKGDVESSLTALKVYEVGKPLVVEEIFPLKCSQEEVVTFIDGSRPLADGWISFYWGKSIEQYEQSDDLKSEIIGSWLRWFRAHAPHPK